MQSGTSSTIELTFSAAKKSFVLVSQNVRPFPLPPTAPRKASRSKKNGSERSPAKTRAPFPMLFGVPVTPVAS